MSFATCCKECSCWCLFTVSAIMLLLMFSLALKDISLVSEQHAQLQQTVNTPIPQLSCVEICQSWYSQERGVLCCDRYNMELCVEKQECKVDYIRSREIAVKILQNDQFHEIVVAMVCGLIMIMIAFRKSNDQTGSQVQQNQDFKEERTRMKKKRTVRKQHRDDTIVTLNQPQELKQGHEKTTTFSTMQDNSSQLFADMMNQTISVTHQVEEQSSHHIQCGKKSNK